MKNPEGSSSYFDNSANSSIEEWEEVPLSSEQGFQKSSEPFYAESELERIKSIPDGILKREELGRFKETLAYQQEGIAGLQLSLMQEIRQHPGVSKAIIEEMVEDFAAEHRLNNHQIQAVHYALREYETKRAAVAEVLEQYPEPSELFEHLFGKLPIDKIVVIPGPMTLFFSCKNVEDYALIHSQSFTRGTVPTKEEITRADMSGGVSIPQAQQSELRGTIIASNGLFSSNREDGKLESVKDVQHFYAKALVVHEEQHAIHRIFRHYDRKMYSPFLRIYDFRTSPKDDTTADKMLTKYLREERVFAEVVAKDEILAYLKTGNPYDSTLATLLRPQSEGGLYDYLASTQIGIESEAQSTGWDTKYLDMLPALQSKVFSLEYQRLLKNGIEAFKTIVEEIKISHDSNAKKSENQIYDVSPNEEAVAYLEHQSLRYWPRVAVRVKERRLGKEYVYDMVNTRTNSKEQYEDEEDILRLPKRESSKHKRTGKNDQFHVKNG